MKPYPQPSWNLASKWSPVGTWWNPGGTLVEPSWNLTSNHPGPPRSPRREPSWNLTSNHPGPPRSLRRTRWNSGGTLVEPSWNLISRPPRTTPEPIWAETPKLSAVGEKEEKQHGPKAAWCKISPPPLQPGGPWDLPLPLCGHLRSGVRWVRFLGVRNDV